MQALDFSRANVTVGEAVGLVTDAPAAGELVARLAADYQAQLERMGALQRSAT